MAWRSDGIRSGPGGCEVLGGAVGWAGSTVESDDEEEDVRPGERVHLDPDSDLSSGSTSACSAAFVEGRRPGDGGSLSRVSMHVGHRPDAPVPVAYGWRQRVHCRSWGADGFEEASGWAAVGGVLSEAEDGGSETSFSLESWDSERMVSAERSRRRFVTVPSAVMTSEPLRSKMVRVVPSGRRTTTVVQPTGAVSAGSLPVAEEGGRVVVGRADAREAGREAVGATDGTGPPVAVAKVLVRAGSQAPSKTGRVGGRS